MGTNGGHCCVVQFSNMRPAHPNYTKGGLGFFFFLTPFRVFTFCRVLLPMSLKYSLGLTVPPSTFFPLPPPFFFSPKGAQMWWRPFRTCLPPPWWGASSPWRWAGATTTPTSPAWWTTPPWPRETRGPSRLCGCCVSDLGTVGGGGQGWGAFHQYWEANFRIYEYWQKKIVNNICHDLILEKVTF